MKNKSALTPIALSLAVLAASPTAFADSSDGGFFGFFQSIGNSIQSSGAFAPRKKQAAKPTFSAPENISGSLADLEAPVSPPSQSLQLATQDSFQISSTTTSDSSVTLTGILPAGSRYVLLRIIRLSDGTQSRDGIDATPGPFSTKAYLPGGAGDYQIRLSVSYDNYNSDQYHVLAKFTVSNTDNRNVQFLLPSVEVQSDSQTIQDLAYAITEDATTPMEKLEAIHFWVIHNVAYDTKTPQVSGKPYDALSVYQNLSGVCDGYTNLTTALLRASGIPAKYVIGTALNAIGGGNCNHAWNEAFVDGRWVTLDTTFDAGYLDGGSFVAAPRKLYFDKDDATFGRTHIKCSEAFK